MYVTIQDRENKLSPKFDGTYRLRSLTGNKACIQSLHDQDIRNVHVEHLKRVSRQLGEHFETQENRNVSVSPASRQATATPREDGQLRQMPDNDYRTKLRSHTRNPVGACQFHQIPILDELGIDIYSYYT